jgi:aspartate kinase
MARIVQKFGGTSVSDIDRIKNVARRVKREVDAGHEVAVIVSAMAGVTNQLVDYVNRISPMHDAREYDTVVASGEQVTCGLLALALQELGVGARSWLGWQIPVRTDDVHGKARIQEILTEEMEKRFRQGQVAVIAGFQGVSPNGRVTTLGRGGSDTSAVAVAAPSGATSSPTSTASIRRTRGSSTGRESSTGSPTKKCSKWPPRAPRCCRPARSRWR